MFKNSLLQRFEFSCPFKESVFGQFVKSYIFHKSSSCKKEITTQYKYLTPLFFSNIPFNTKTAISQFRLTKSTGSLYQQASHLSKADLQWITMKCICVVQNVGHYFHSPVL